jgi:ribosomal protein L37AE/L43A
MKGCGMAKRALFPGFKPVFAGFAGATVGGQPVPLLIMTIIVLSMALISVFDSVLGSGAGGVNLDKQIPFKCTNAKCNEIVMYTIRDLQKMQKPGAMGPMMGPMTLNCPKCNNKTLTQAVECPKCKEVFVMKMDPSKGLFDDKCPKCHESYAKAWQEKYRKSKE